MNLKYFILKYNFTNNLIMEFAKLFSKMIAKLELVVRTTVIKAAKKGLSIVSILLPFVSLVFKKHEILEKG